MEILTLHDGSPLAGAVLPYAEAIARATGATVRRFGVVERESGGMETWPDDLRSYVKQTRLDALGEILSAITGDLRDRGVAAESSVVLGNPADEILAAAAGADVTMVVMATQGRGGIDRLLIGSVADNVMRIRSWPVLLVRPPGTPGRSPTVSLRRLMVPLDGSPLAEEALPLAAKLATAASATLTLVRVEPFVTVGAAPIGANIDFTQLDETAVALAETYLEEIHRRLHSAARVEAVVLRGIPTPSLIAFAENEDVDLVVMSTHGRGGLRRLALGSTAERLVRAGVPTLLVHMTATNASQRPRPGIYEQVR